LGKILPVDHVNHIVAEIGDIEAALLGIGRKVHGPGRASGSLWRNVDLADETALPCFAFGVRARLADFSGFEDLNAIVSAIASVEQTVIGKLGAVHWTAEEFRFHVAGLVVLRPGTGAFARVFSRLSTAPAIFTDDRILAVRAEVANIFSGGSVNHQDAAITVSIGDVEVVRFWIDDHIRGPERLG